MNPSAGALPEQRISMVALGVRDLDRARDFYTRVLGWVPHTHMQKILFFDMGGMVFAIAQKDLLIEDMKSETAGEDAATSVFSLAYNARSEEDVDRIFARLKEHDAAIVKEPETVFWGGYSGYFSDPDGYKWEVAYNPFWQLNTDGQVQLPVTDQSG